MPRRPVRFAALALALTSALAVAAEGGGPSPEPFVVGIEDELRILVWGEPELSVSVKVRPDGKITVPLIHDIHVEGLTTDQIRSKIRQALGEFVVEANVTVMLQSLNSYRIYFLGEVRRQGALQFYRPVRLIQAIAAAGGLTEFAKKEIVLLREENGVEAQTRIDYKRLVAGDPAQPNIVLKAGDTLIFN